MQNYTVKAQSPGDLNMKSKHERNKKEIRLYWPHDNENGTENRKRIKNKRLQMRNQWNEETGRETRSNLSMLGREKEMASEEFEEESYLFMYQGSKHATNSNREEERWPRPVPYSFALLSLSLSYLPPELDVAIETKAESTNREEPAWKRTSLGVRMDGCDGLTVRLHGSDERRRKLRRSPTTEMVEITSRSIDWGSCKRRNG